MNHIDIQVNDSRAYRAALECEHEASELRPVFEVIDYGAIDGQPDDGGATLFFISEWGNESSMSLTEPQIDALMTLLVFRKQFRAGKVPKHGEEPTVARVESVINAPPAEVSGEPCIVCGEVHE